MSASSILSCDHCGAVADHESRYSFSGAWLSVDDRTSGERSDKYDFCSWECLSGFAEKVFAEWAAEELER